MASDEYLILAMSFGSASIAFTLLVRLLAAVEESLGRKDFRHG